MMTSDPTQGLLSLVALDPRLPAGLAAALARDTRATQCALASNPACPATVRDLLRNAQTPAVRAAALNHDTDPDRLSAAATSRHQSTRRAAAANAHTPAQALRAMAAGAGPKDAPLTRALLSNPGLPADAATDLAARIHLGHAWAPGRGLTANQGSSVWRSLGMATVLDAHPHTAHQWLADPDSTAIRVIAQSPALTADAAAALAGLTGERPQRANVHIQRALAENPATPAHVSDALTAATARAARTALLTWFDATEDTIAARVGAALTTEDGVRHAAAAGSRTIDWMLAAHPGTTREAALLVCGRHPLGRNDPHVDPYTIARLVNRFGATAALTAFEAQSAARMRPAANVSPLLGALLAFALDERAGQVAWVGDTLAELAATRDTGDTSPVWGLAVRLLRSHGLTVTPAELAAVVVGIAL